MTTPVSAFTPSLRIRQTIFRIEKGFETIHEVANILGGIHSSSGHASKPKNQVDETEVLMMEGLKLDESEGYSGTHQDATKQPVDKVALFGQILHMLHACLANERSRMRFDVSAALRRAERVTLTKPFGYRRWEDGLHTNRLCGPCAIQQRTLTHLQIYRNNLPSPASAVYRSWESSDASGLWHATTSPRLSASLTDSPKPSTRIKRSSKRIPRFPTSPKSYRSQQT